MEQLQLLQGNLRPSSSSRFSHRPPPFQNPSALSSVLPLDFPWGITASAPFSVSMVGMELVLPLRYRVGHVIQEWPIGRVYLAGHCDWFRDDGLIRAAPSKDGLWLLLVGRWSSFPDGFLGRELLAAIVLVGRVLPESHCRKKPTSGDRQHLKP